MFFFFWRYAQIGWYLNYIYIYLNYIYIYTLYIPLSRNYNYWIPLIHNILILGFGYLKPTSSCVHTGDHVRRRATLAAGTVGLLGVRFWGGLGWPMVAFYQSLHHIVNCKRKERYEKEGVGNVQRREHFQMWSACRHPRKMNSTERGKPNAIRAYVLIPPSMVKSGKLCPWYPHNMVHITSPYITSPSNTWLGLSLSPSLGT